LTGTFQDATYTTAGIGLEYLWIDYPCIYQDSKEDWIKESATMAPVHENTTCTISAAVVSNSHYG
ncbi:hypothetical protein CC78DRAFT_413402, partial [Lojkania enalia]